MTRTLMTTLFALLTLPLMLWGCPASDDDDSAGDDDAADDDAADDDAGDDDAGDSYEVTVNWDTSSEVVDLFTLTAVDFEGVDSIMLPALLTEAGISSPENYTYGFTAFDDYSKDGYTWDQVQLSALVQDSGDLEWDDSLGMVGGDHVGGVVTIDLSAVE